MCAGHAIDGDDDDIRVFLAVLVVVGAEQDWACFFAERPAGASSFLGGRQRFIAAHRSRVLHSQPARQPPLACSPCLLLRFAAALARLLTLVPSKQYYRTAPLITRPPPTTPLSFVRRLPRLTAATPHPIFTSDNSPIPIVNNQQTNTHPLFTTPACCPYRSLSPAIARPAYRSAHTHSSLCV